MDRGRRMHMAWVVMVVMTVVIVAHANVII
jgi:hypothetical protein